MKQHAFLANYPLTPDDITAIEQFIAAPHGQTLFIAGPSGLGKTILMKQIAQAITGKAALLLDDYKPGDAGHHTDNYIAHTLAYPGPVIVTSEQAFPPPTGRRQSITVTLSVDVFTHTVHCFTDKTLRKNLPGLHLAIRYANKLLQSGHQVKIYQYRPPKKYIDYLIEQEQAR